MADRINTSDVMRLGERVVRHMWAHQDEDDGKVRYFENKYDESAKPITTVGMKAWGANLAGPDEQGAVQIGNYVVIAGHEPLAGMEVENALDYVARLLAEGLTALGMTRCVTNDEALTLRDAAEKKRDGKPHMGEPCIYCGAEDWIDKLETVCPKRKKNDDGLQEK